MRSTSASASAAVQAGGGSAPFGLPVLAELPDLTAVLASLAVADDALLDAVAGLADLVDIGEVEQRTGVGVEHWLSIVACQTRMDRRLLLRTCRLLHRLPSLHAAVRGRRVSFAQLRGLALALRDVPVEVDGDLDTVLATLLDGLDTLDRPDPDALVRQMGDAVDELCDRLERAERDAAVGRHLWLQPFLDQTGGRFGGQLDAAGLALLDAATTPNAATLEASGGYGAARADTMLARLASSVTASETAGLHTHTASGTTASAHTDTTHANGASVDDTTGDAPDTGTAAAAAVDDTAPVDWRDRLAPPKLLLRLPFEALCDPAVPAELLTTLTGGRLRLTSAAATRLANARGADLRTIVIDGDGAVIGVGRSTRRPPGWLDDAIAAVHDTCTAPGCDRPARGADRDHAVPWWPAHPDDPAGTTDVANIGPLCPATNRDKEAAGWQAVQTATGTRTWRHHRTGLTATTVPSTWRPPDDPRRRRRRPAGTDPPGPDGPGAFEAADDLPGANDAPGPGHPATGSPSSTSTPPSPSSDDGEGGPDLPF